MVLWSKRAKKQFISAFVHSTFRVMKVNVDKVIETFSLYTTHEKSTCC